MGEKNILITCNNCQFLIIHFNSNSKVNKKKNMNIIKINYGTLNFKISMYA